MELMLEDFLGLEKMNLASSVCLEWAVKVSCACSSSEMGCTSLFQERAWEQSHVRVHGGRKTKELWFALLSKREQTTLTV